MIKSNDHTPLHEHLALIKWKQAVYSKFVQLGGFAESHLEHRKKYSKRGSDCNRVLA